MKLTRTTKSTLAISLVVALLGAGPAFATEPQNPPANPPGARSSTSEKPEEPAWKQPASDVPPTRGSVGARTGGGTRGRAEAPRIAVLAPDHIGLTTRAQPALAWFLSAETTAPVELTVIADGAVAPLVVKQLPSPQRAGIHVVDLAELGVQLAEGTTYDWYVALVLDPNARDADVVAGGAIARRAPTPELVAELAADEPSYRVLARHGIWYDAIADLSAAVDAAPSGTPAGHALRAERAALLEQVGVGAVAQYDREDAIRSAD